MTDPIDWISDPDSDQDETAQPWFSEDSFWGWAEEENSDEDD